MSNFAQVLRSGEFDFQWPLRLQVTQHDDGCGTVLLDGFDDVAEIAVRVATKQDYWIFHRGSIYVRHAQ